MRQAAARRREAGGVVALALGAVGSGCAAERTVEAAAPVPALASPEAFTPLGVNAQGAALYRRPRDGARMVWIPAGSFRMNGYFPRPVEDPEFEEVFVDAFAIDETEVTNRQFAQFLDATGIHVDADGRPLLHEVADGLRFVDGAWRSAAGCEELPALGVTGWGAVAYARWVGGDLPLLPEWQKAAGGVEGRIFPWGSEAPTAVHANYRRCGPDAPMPVGSYPGGAGPFGCLDMAGNVYERVWSARGGGRSAAMIRGGSWASPHPLNLRTFDLCMQPMDVGDRTVGFRCVVRTGAGLPLPPAGPLRFAAKWGDALREARERNVPILLSLQYDTCGQCDRTKVGLFRDPDFVRACNSEVVLVVGHVPHDGGDDPHREDASGSCPLYPGISCFDHIDLFYEGLKRVDFFQISPGNFLLDPCTSDDSRERSEWILVDERELPKSGVGTEAYLEQFRHAQALLGQPRLSHEEWLAAAGGSP